jgi:hypothetical protein
VQQICVVAYTSDIIDYVAYTSDIIASDTEKTTIFSA